MSARPKLVALAIGVLSAVSGAASAQAAAPVPFTITEHINVLGDSFTFTATGPLCPSGTFEDEGLVGAGHPNPPGVQNSVAQTVYTCDDGSGTFSALKLNHITIGPTSQTNAGQIQLHGGTGAYSSLIGHGVNNGMFDFVTLTGTGNIAGLVTDR
jgi:hypothetical protein